MAYARLTVVWFHETHQHLVKAGPLDNDIDSRDRLLFSIDGRTDTDEDQRELIRKFDDHLAPFGLTRDDIANLDDIAWLIPPLRYD